MFRFDIDASDLLRWARVGEDAEMETRPALARALNAFGERIVDTVAEEIEENTGLQGVRDDIVVYQADANRLLWEMDASKAVPAGTQWGREWTEQPGAEEFAVDRLWVIKNDYYDDDCCEVCKEIIEGGPITTEQLNNLSIKWAHWEPPASVKGDRSNLIHPNAVLEGSTFASYGLVHEMVAAVFNGPAVRLRTDIRDVTIGPNHPMLTGRGFVAANQITEGDQLLYDLRSKDAGITTAAAGRKPHFQKVPLVQDVFDALVGVSDHARVAAASSDLHGDAVFCDDEVDVIRPTRNLLEVLDPRRVKQFSELPLARSDAELQAVSSIGSRDLGGQAVTLAPPGGMGRSDAWVLADDGFRWATVLSVDHVTFSGLAFDATTFSSLYCSDGFVVHNCRCYPRPFRSMRRVPVSMGQRGAAKTRTMTAESLARVMAQALAEGWRAAASKKK